MYRLVNASKLLKLHRLKIRNTREISVSNRLYDEDDEVIDEGPRELGIDESWKPPRIEFDPVWFQSLYLVFGRAYSSFSKIVLKTTRVLRGTRRILAI